MTRARMRLSVALLILGGPLAGMGSAQVLETETARLRLKGAVQVGGNFEYQTSSEGHESALPFVFEYGVNDRLELVLEPVAATHIRPKRGVRASGWGDMEATAQYLVHREDRWPALAVAGEVKFPTARNTLIGTGQTDVAALLIASKRLGRADLHVNVSYTRVGQPPGVNLSDTLGGAVALMVPVKGRYRVYGEVLASTSAGGGEGDPTATGTSAAPEAAGQELVGTVGIGAYFSPRLFLSLGVSYDNTHAVLFRPGITFRTR